MLEFNKET